MLDTWKVTAEDIAVATVSDMETVAEAIREGVKVYALGNPETGDVTCFLFVDVTGSPVVLTEHTAVTSPAE